MEDDIINTQRDKISIVKKFHVENVLKEIDPEQVVDEKAMNLILKDLNTFASEILNSSCDLATCMNDNILSWKHLSTELQNKFNITIPGYSNVMDENNTNFVFKKTN